MPDRLFQTLPTFFNFVESLSHSTVIINQESPVDHDLELPFIEHRGALTAVCQDSHRPATQMIFNSNKAIDGVKVAGYWFEEF